MTSDMRNPGAGDAGARDRLARRLDSPDNSRKPRKPASRVILHTEDGDKVVSVKGRVAWTLGKLIAAGERGITPLDCPTGVRLAHYVFRLRSEGIVVETERETHDGPFSGTHARYILRSPVSFEQEGET